MEILWIVVGVLGCGNALFAWLYFTKERPKVRKDLQAILDCIKDFETRGGALLEIRRVNPDDVFIWGRR